MTSTDITQETLNGQSVAIDNARKQTSIDGLENAVRSLNQGFETRYGMLATHDAARAELVGQFCGFMTEIAEKQPANLSVAIAAGRVIESLAAKLMQRVRANEIPAGVEDKLMLASLAYLNYEGSRSFTVQARHSSAHLKGIAHRLRGHRKLAA